MIIKNDGTTDNVSIKKCCGIKVYKKNELKKAMRNAVAKQIINFKRQFNYNFTCSFCKKNGTDSYTFHADHIVFFNDIANNFLKENSNIPTSFKKQNELISFNDCDMEFKEKWEKYHEKYAKLRILCDTCNLNRTIF